MWYGQTGNALCVKQLRSKCRIKHVLLFNAMSVVVFLSITTWRAHSTQPYTYKTTTQRTIFIGDTWKIVTVNNLTEQQGIVQAQHKISVSSEDLVEVADPEPRYRTTHIAFLKVHKAGSTTMQNMFFRFGLKYNLTFVLPKTNRNYVLRTSTAIPVAAGNHHDILACHSRYSRTLFQSILPKDTVNIGIIREPLQRMISAAFYFRDVWHSKKLSEIPRDQYIHNIILQPDLYDTRPFSKTKNAMGNDFGFSPLVKEKDTQKINSHLDMLRNDFKLVMVMERFEESLVLLKRDLNWSLSDIIYIQSNSHEHTRVSLNKTELEMFKSTCFLDYAIYNTFYRIFDERVRRERTSLQPEVNYFKRILKKVKDFCIKKKHENKPLHIHSSKWNEAFTVTSEDCLYMGMEEMEFINRLKLRHNSMNNL